MIPRFGDTPDPARDYRRRPGVYAILSAGDMCLMTQQHGPEPDIQLPGGGIDPGEHPIAALHREVMEETGWRISRPRRLGAFRRFVFMPEYDLWADKFCTVYLARPVRRLAPPSEPDHSALWLPMTQAAQRLGNAGDRYMLRRFLGTERFAQPLRRRW